MTQDLYSTPVFFQTAHGSRCKIEIVGEMAPHIIVAKDAEELCSLCHLSHSSV